MTELPQHLAIHEIGNTYVDEGNRFVVSLVVGYGGSDSREITTPEAAGAAALRLTQDEGSEGTHWYVYDRDTGALRLFEQGELEDWLALHGTR